MNVCVQRCVSLIFQSLFFPVNGEWKWSTAQEPQRALPASHVGKGLHVEFPFSQQASAPGHWCRGRLFSHLYLALWGVYIHTRCVPGGQPGSRPFGGAKSRLVCALDFISPYTVFIRFLIWTSGRVHCFETNLSKFRTDFPKQPFSFLHKFYS